MPPSNRKQMVSLCLIEPNPLARDLLLDLLSHEESIHATSLDSLAAIRERSETQVVFLLDNCGLPLPLSEYLRCLRVRYADAKFIVLDRKLSVEEMVRLLWLKIDGFLPYPDVRNLLLPAIHSVREDKIWAPREVLRKFVQYAEAVHSRPRRSVADITLREYQIIELVKRRLSNKEIAEILRIRESTVKYHLSNIYSKLHVGNRHGLLNTAPTPRGSLLAGLAAMGSEA